MRRETEKGKLAHIHPGDRDEGSESRDARDGDDSNTGFKCERNEKIARIRQSRRPGVRDERHALSRRESLDDLPELPLLGMLVTREGRRRDLEMIEQLLGHPGVFGEDQLDAFQSFKCTQGDIAQVADRCRDDVEDSRHTKYELRSTRKTRFPHETT